MNTHDSLCMCAVYNVTRPITSDVVRVQDLLTQM